MGMFNPAHPGEVLREYLPEGMTVKEAAKRLGVTRQALSALLNGRSGVS
ncbi:MAG: helix-turn-helix domain-containing protein, partial [Gammaproteobacteria bacterium]|nr:helix-turn-helix domain-containing protein [Gammaproteobacteria bacterium]